MIEIYREMLQLVDRGEPAVLCTVISTQGSCPQEEGSKMLLRSDGTISGTVGGGTFEHRVIEEAKEVLASGVPRRYRAQLTRDLAMCCGGTMEVFLEPLATAPPLILFGAGHVGSALAAVATVAGFRVVVVDEREEFARMDRLAGVDEVHCCPPQDLLDRLPWGPRTFAVIVTHSHALDEDLLLACARKPWRYLGMIGSVRKVRRFQDRYLSRGGDRDVLERIHAPIGLDLGAREPGEIAVAVVAEMIRVLRGTEERPPHPLRRAPRQEGDSISEGLTPPSSLPMGTEEGLKPVL